LWTVVKSEPRIIFWGLVLGSSSRAAFIGTQKSTNFVCSEDYDKLAGYTHNKSCNYFAREVPHRDCLTDIGFMTAYSWLAAIVLTLSRIRRVKGGGRGVDTSVKVENRERFLSLSDLIGLF
jgi:hypothetical protein